MTAGKRLRHLGIQGQPNLRAECMNYSPHAVRLETTRLAQFSVRAGRGKLLIAGVRGVLTACGWVRTGLSAGMGVEAVLELMIAEAIKSSAIEAKTWNATPVISFMSNRLGLNPEPQPVSQQRSLRTLILLRQLAQRL